MPGKQLEIQGLPEPIGKFVLDNAQGVQVADGMYYHYSEVCSLLRKYKKHLEEKKDKG